ncbi:MAG TPA: class I SAM-dependent methyltransferase [Verrucomicrobiae bacterium]|nr:class I SAM-dependent methyltransferase [Verrucomicrobiae bacterium]
MQAAYYSEYAAIQREHWWYRARAEILEAILARRLHPGRQRLVLDIGCGPGGMRPMLSQFGRLVSTDFTFEALQFCAAQKLDHLVAADGMRLPFRNGEFDAAVAFDVIEHLNDDGLGARELFRVLKPQGLLFVTVPAFQFLWGRQDIVSHHFRRYNAGGLSAVVRGAGFDIEQISYFNTFLFPPIAAIRLAYRWLGLNHARKDEEMKSDFSMPHQGWLNELPRKIFASEKPFLLRGNLPFGVSLLCIARKPQ